MAILHKSVNQDPSTKRASKLSTEPLNRLTARQLCWFDRDLTSSSSSHGYNAENKYNIFLLKRALSPPSLMAVRQTRLIRVCDTCPVHKLQKQANHRDL